MGHRHAWLEILHTAGAVLALRVERLQWLLRTGPEPLEAVAFQYDHVANVKRIHFTNPIAGVAGNFVEPVNQGGFWAIFVICSLDVQGSELTSFNYNAGNFFVENGNTSYGAMQPFQVRYGASTTLK